MQIDTNKIFHSPGGTAKQPRTHRTQSKAPKKTVVTDVGLRPQINIFDLKGFQSRYSVMDAAKSLWQRENTIVQRDDAASVARLQARLRSGNLRMTPTQEEITGYLCRLRKDGLDGRIDWHGLESEFRSFRDMPAEELSESLNYVASRYVSVLDKLRRNFTGAELAEQESMLENIWVAGMTGLIDGYTRLLQSNLGISARDAQVIRVSLDALVEQRVRIYHTLVERTNAAAAQTGPDSFWLCNHDAYMATQLREAAVPNKSGSLPARGTYSIQDLSVAGRIAQAYQSEIESACAGSRNEAQLALNLAFVDMKAETLIQKNLVSEEMAKLLRKSRFRGHSVALEALGRYLDSQMVSRPSDELERPSVAIEYAIFHDIYKAILNAYCKNGGSGPEALRAGVEQGEIMTTQAYANNPKAARWGAPMKRYWETFYTVPDPRKQTRSEREIEELLAKIGRSPRSSNSTHQNYINDWQAFLTSIDKRTDILELY